MYSLVLPRADVWDGGEPGEVFARLVEAGRAAGPGLLAVGPAVLRAGGGRRAGHRRAALARLPYDNLVVRAHRTARLLAHLWLGQGALGGRRVRRPRRQVAQAERAADGGGGGALPVLRRAEGDLPGEGRAGVLPGARRVQLLGARLGLPGGLEGWKRRRRRDGGDAPGWDRMAAGRPWLWLKENRPGNSPTSAKYLTQSQVREEENTGFASVAVAITWAD